MTFPHFAQSLSDSVCLPSDFDDRTFCLFFNHVCSGNESGILYVDILFSVDPFGVSIYRTGKYICKLSEFLLNLIDFFLIYINILCILT